VANRSTKANRLVVTDAGWAETIPDWLLAEVRNERILLGLAGIMKPETEGEVGDAEVCAYLYTASLRAPMSQAHTEIYLNLAAKLMERRGTQVPDDMRGHELRPAEIDELRELRRELWRVRGGRISSPLLAAMRGLKEKLD
jgi:hypothetical protein